MGDAASKPDTGASIQESHHPIQKRIVDSLGRWGYWSAAMVGVGVLSFGRKLESEGLLIVLFAFGFFACQVVSVVLHELGHVLAALLAGIRPVQVVIGHGEQLVRLRIAGIPWAFHTRPTSGHVVPSCSGLHLIRLRMFVMVLGGPIVNVVLVIGAASLLWASLDQRANFHLSDMGAYRLFLLLVANGILICFGLWPSERQVGGIKRPNDGQLLLYWLNPRTPVSQYYATGELIQTLQTAREQLKISAGSDPRGASATPRGSITSLYWAPLVGDLPETDIARVVRHALEMLSLSAEGRIQLLDAFATWVLFAGAVEYLDEADNYSEELLRIRPESWTVKGTRGSVLVEKGEIAAGMKMLMEVMDHDPSVFDRAISACFLAVAELKQNHIDAARQWVDKAHTLDSNCMALGRVEALLKSHASP